MFKYPTVVVVERSWQLAAAVIVVVMMQSTMMLMGISGITSAINMIHDAAIDSVTLVVTVADRKWEYQHQILMMWQ